MRKIRGIYFELSDGTLLRPSEDFGLDLASFDISPPKPRVNRIQIEGRNGQLDMTEWAGMVFYDDRTVKAVLRLRGHRDLSEILAVNGRAVKLRLPPIEGYYEGRCTSVKSKITRPWEEYTFEFACDPYRVIDQATAREATVPAGEEVAVALRALRRPAVPTLTVTGGDVTIDDSGAAYTEGTHVLSGLVLTDQPTTVIVASTEGSTVRFTWKDGDF